MDCTLNDPNRSDDTPLDGGTSEGPGPVETGGDDTDTDADVAIAVATIPGDPAELSRVGDANIKDGTRGTATPNRMTRVWSSVSDNPPK